eukprot:scaffold15944_cov115-Isochrysis_galbana.AAC.5
MRSRRARRANLIRILFSTLPLFSFPQRSHRGARPLAVAGAEAEGCRPVMSALGTDRALKH